MSSASPVFGQVTRAKMIHPVFVSVKSAGPFNCQGDILQFWWYNLLAVRQAGNNFQEEVENGTEGRRYA